MSGSSPTFFHSPAVVALARGAVLIGVLAVLFWGVRTCITAPAEKPMAVAEKLIEAGREAGLTLINKGFSSNHGGVALIVQKDEKVANLVTVERTFEYEYRYSTTWWWSRKTLILKAAYRAHGGINLEGPEPLRIIIPAGNKGPITAEGLHGKLISCEMVEGSLRIVKDDAGIWNRLTSEDAAIAVNQLNENARKHIMESGLKKISSNASGKKPGSRKNLPGRTAGSEVQEENIFKAGCFRSRQSSRSTVPHSALLSCQTGLRPIKERTSWPI